MTYRVSLSTSKQMTSTFRISLLQKYSVHGWSFSDRFYTILNYSYIYFILKHKYNKKNFNCTIIYFILISHTVDLHPQVFISFFVCTFSPNCLNLLLATFFNLWPQLRKVWDKSYGFMWVSWLLWLSNSAFWNTPLSITKSHWIWHSLLDTRHPTKKPLSLL